VHPQVAKARARVAALTRVVRAGERPQKDLDAAKRDLEKANRTAYIDRLVANAPAFTPEQIDQLRVLLEPARRDLANTRPGGGDAA